jgi:hypothetical protein
MTTRLTIKNEDSGRSVRVRTRDLSVGDDGQHTGACSENEPPRMIASGESATFYVHKDRDLVIEEIEE